MGGKTNVGPEVAMGQALQERGTAALCHRGRPLHDEVGTKAVFVDAIGLERHDRPRVAAEVAELALVEQRREDEVVAIDVEPGQGHVGTTVRIERYQVPVRTRGHQFDCSLSEHHAFRSRPAVDRGRP